MGKRKKGDTPKEILGRYRVDKEIGAGMMGTVYRGHDTLIDRLVAIKAIRLPSGGSSDSDVRALRERFLIEARAAGRITHPNVVTLYDVAQEGDDFFLIFEFVEGKPLGNFLKRGKLDPDRARRIALGAARGLAAAHAYGVVHRDIKPANLILSDGDQVKIADFGVARLEGSTLTQTGQTVGTPAYMSPEQAQGKKLDGRSDVFSLGVVLYEMLTGTNPFQAANAPAAMLKVAYEEPPPLQDVARGVPDAFETLVRWTLGKDPKVRPDAAALARELEAMSLQPYEIPEKAKTPRSMPKVKVAKVKAAKVKAPRAPGQAWRTAWSVVRGVAIAAVVVAGWLVVSILRDPYADARDAIEDSNYPAAIEMLERAGVERAADPERHLLIASAALRGENFRRARAAVDSLLARDPSFRDRLTLAALFDTTEWAERTDHRQAARELLQIQRALPPDPGVALERARHLWLAGSRDEAIAVAREGGIADARSRLYVLDLASEDCGVRLRAAEWYAANPSDAPIGELRDAHARSMVITNTRGGLLGRIFPKPDTTYTCDREALERAIGEGGGAPKGGRESSD